MLKNQPNPLGMNQSGEALTPEEKLFRVITAANRNEEEMEELLKRFSLMPQPKIGKKIVKTFKECWLEGWKRIENFGVGILEGLRRRPRWIPVLILGVVAFMVWLFASSLKPEKNFYFYGNTEAAQKIVARETASVKAPSAAVVVSAPVEQPPYKLVGISWDGTNRIAMIETPVDNRARFVRQGETLPGDAKVLEVKDHTVVLSAGSRTWEIS